MSCSNADESIDYKCLAKIDLFVINQLDGAEAIDTFNESVQSSMNNSAVDLFRSFMKEEMNHALKNAISELGIGLGFSSFRFKSRVNEKSNQELRLLLYSKEECPCDSLLDAFVSNLNQFFVDQKKERLKTYNGMTLFDFQSKLDSLEKRLDQLALSALIDSEKKKKERELEAQYTQLLEQKAALEIQSAGIISEDGLCFPIEPAKRWK